VIRQSPGGEGKGVLKVWGQENFSNRKRGRTGILFWGRDIVKHKRGRRQERQQLAIMKKRVTSKGKKMVKSVKRKRHGLGRDQLKGV